MLLEFKEAQALGAAELAEVRAQLAAAEASLADSRKRSRALEEADTAFKRC